MKNYDKFTRPIMKLESPEWIDNVEIKPTLNEVLWVLETAVGRVTEENGVEIIRGRSLFSYMEMDLGIERGENYVAILKQRARLHGVAFNAYTGDVVFTDEIQDSDVLVAMKDVHGIMEESTIGDLEWNDILAFIRKEP